MLEVPAVAFWVNASGVFSAPVLMVSVWVISAILFAPMESMSPASNTANGDGDSKFSLRLTKLPVTMINSTSCSFSALSSWAIAILPKGIS